MDFGGANVRHLYEFLMEYNVFIKAGNFVKCLAGADQLVESVAKPETFRGFEDGPRLGFLP